MRANSKDKTPPERHVGVKSSMRHEFLPLGASSKYPGVHSLDKVFNTHVHGVMLRVKTSFYNHLLTLVCLVHTLFALLSKRETFTAGHHTAQKF